MYPVSVLFYPDPLFYIRILDFFQNLDIFVKLNLLSYPVFGLFITNNYDDINIFFNNILYNVYCIPLFLIEDMVWVITQRDILKLCTVKLNKNVNYAASGTVRFIIFFYSLSFFFFFDLIRSHKFVSF